MAEFEDLKFNSKVFEGIRDQLDKMIQAYTNIAMQSNKSSEINLKINIDVINTYDEENENVIRPLYECKLNGKIKETKDEIKGTLGDNYILKRDEESGELYIKEINEQLNFDVLRANQIAKKIKKKTFCFKIKTLSIFINLGDNVHILDNEEYKFNNIDCINLKDMEDISKYRFVIDEFPDITRNTKFPEDGFELFAKLSREISEKSGEDAKKAEDIFQKRKPIMTYILIGINTILFVLMYILGNGSDDALTLLKFGASYPDFIRAGEYYRLLTSAFLHIGFLHFLFNNYALYVIGSQLESFFGKTKYLIIYLGSAIFGNLMSLLFTNSISAGASGAIFGLLGALLYFGYHYRVYLGTVVKSQIIPLIIINLGIGFAMSGVNNSAHIGGLIGGCLI